MIEIDLSPKLLWAIDASRGELSRDEFIEMALTAIISPEVLDRMAVWIV